MMHAVTGKQFKYKVRGAGLKLADVANKAGVSVSTASAWYNGHQDILLSGTYNKLVEAFEELSNAEDI